MKKHIIFSFSMLMVLLLITTCFGFTYASETAQNSINGISFSNIESLDISDLFENGSILDKTLNNEYQENIKIDPNEEVPVIINLEGKSLIEIYIESGKNGTVANFAQSAQGIEIIREIEEKQNLFKSLAEKANIDITYNYSYNILTNGLSGKTKYSNIAALENIDGVENVVLDMKYSKPNTTVSVSDLISSNGILKNETGYNGSGTLITIVDTGLDWKHEAFSVMPEITSVNINDIEALVNLMSFNTNGLYTVNDLYRNNKVVFGFDYCDKDPDIIPNDTSITNSSNYHGTHVAGISAGNCENFKGVAPEAQLAIMKVFGDFGTGGYTSDIVASLGDAVLLGTDVINMSLGTPVGFTYERDDSYTYINDVYKYVESIGISLIVSAGNTYDTSLSSAMGENPTYNVDIGTIGSPSSYDAAFSIASIESTGVNFLKFNNSMIFYNEGVNASTSRYFNFIKTFLENNQAGSYEYVSIPDGGIEEAYANLDVKGKIALIQRGNITFAQKVLNAQNAGAIAAIIYNNTTGMINMSIDQTVNIPMCSISMKDGLALVESQTKNIEIDSLNLTEPIMSDFSSWGLLSDMTLKPDITAPGGNIYSSVPQAYGSLYASMNGTSMAAPNMSGVAALLRQYIKEKYPHFTDKQIQAMVYQLAMSTATPVMDIYGNPAFVRKQGAGLVNVNNAIKTKAYLTVTGSDRTKLELGDDPERSGKYTYNFNLVNLSAEELNYEISMNAFTESIGASGLTVTHFSYLLDGNMSVSIMNGKINENIITVAPFETVKITVKFILDDASKDYLNDNFECGYFVEGFIKLSSCNEDEIDLSIPWVAFYGDFTNPPVFDTSIYEDGIVLFDKTTPFISYKDQYMIPAGMFPYKLPEGMKPVPTTDDNAAMSIFTSTTNGIATIRMYLLRNVSKLTYTLTDELTGDILWTDYGYNIKKAYYNTNADEIIYTAHSLALNPLKLGLSNNQTVRLTVKAQLDYYRSIEQEFSFKVFVDYENPVLLDSMTFEENGRKYLSLDLYDNHKLMNYQLYTLNQEENSLGELIVDHAFPIYEWNEGQDNNLLIDVTDYLTKIAESGNNFIAFYTEDWAMNAVAWAFDLSDLMPEETADANQAATNAFRNSRMQNQVIEATDNGDETTEPEFVVEDGVLIKYNGTNPEVIIPDNLGITEIGKALFDGNSFITKVVIPKGVTKINDNAFRRCSTVTEIILPDTIEHVGNYALSYMTSCKEIIFPESLQTFGYCLFFGSSGFERIIFKGSVPNGTSSQSFFMYNCTNLKELILPEGLTTIGCQAFLFCKSLTSLTLPSTVTHITGGNGFYGMTSLLSLTILNPNPAVLGTNEFGTSKKGSNPDRNIYVPAGTKELYQAQWSTVADQIEDISQFTINENKTLTAYTGNDDFVIIPDGVKAIGENVFTNNTKIKKIFTPLTLTEISSEAFMNCIALTEALLTFKTTNINARAFKNTGLTSIILPVSLNTIGDEAFADNKSLMNIEVINRIPAKLGINVFANLSSDCKIIIPEKTMDAYKNAWTDVIDNMQEVNPYIIVDGVLTAYTGIGGDLILPGGITEIADSVFASNPTITSVIISDGVVKLGNKVFYGATNLKKVEIADSVTTVGEYLMSMCINLTEVKWSNNLHIIPMGCFENCTGLTNWYIPEHITNIEHYGFHNTGLIEITIPKSVTSLGFYAFFDSVNLKKLICYGSSERFMNAFGKLFGLEEAVFYGDIGVIDGYDFSESTLIKQIDFYGNITSIQNFTFDDMDALETVNFYGNIESIGGLAFNNCPNLQNVIFHKQFGGISLEGNYAAAFASCPKLTSFKVSEDNEYLAVDKYGVLYNKEMTYVYIQPNGWDYDGTYIMPDTVTYVEDNAFYGTFWYLSNFEYTAGGGWKATCSTRWEIKPNLKGVQLSGNLEYLGAYSFYGYNTYTNNNGQLLERGFTNIESITFGETNQNSFLVIGDYAFAYNSKAKIKIPASLKEVGSYSFAYTNSEELILPEGFENLGIMAFAYNNALTKVSIPSTMKPNNFASAFIGCKNLKTYDINENNPYFLVVNNFILDADEKILYSYLGKESNLIIPEGIIYISANSFLNNETITHVTLPSTLQAIGDKAFYGTKCYNYTFLGKNAPTLRYLYDTANEDMDVQYANFVEYLEYLESYEIQLTINYPADGNYDNWLWRSYFSTRNAIDENGNIVEPENIENNVNSIINMISEINTDVSLEDKDMINAIREAYDNLKITEKVQVTNLNMLIAAENKIIEIEKSTNTPISQDTDIDINEKVTDNLEIINMNNNDSIYITISILVLMMGAALIIKFKK